MAAWRRSDGKSTIYDIYDRRLTMCGQIVDGEIVVRRFLRQSARVGLFGIMVAAGVADVLGQAGSGAVTGVIRDQAGAAVPGAAITVTEAHSNLQRRVVSSSFGVYLLPGLAPGEYRVRVDLSGFRPLVRDGIHLATGETIRLDLDLALGDVNETVTVTADAPLLQGETASLGQVVDHQKIVELPLNGRSFISLAALAPGVALPPGSPLPRINGGRPRTNEYLFDGISVLQPEPGQVAFFPSSTRFRNSRSRATVRPPSSAGSTAASST